jgi:hypothetical protein
MPSRSGDPALFESNKDALGAVRRWLALNRDVIVTGDVGSGRSLLLAELLYRSVSRASAVLLRAAGDGPLAAFHAQPSFAQSGVGPTVTDATAWLMDEVGGHKGTLLVDDLDQLDPSAWGSTGSTTWSPKSWAARSTCRWRRRCCPARAATRGSRSP